ncbi:hypothetical protein ColLi_02294 [Colletotrichum liriopes]|uniref:Uncharacterized protein n=1 Tax=Colletotrichum liriopes TaxID=708192 RepID=A0AA37GEI0_9PEZI|nr:hypothetical protein ColLi_02294 [Colletotrichum liriopes]
MPRVTVDRDPSVHPVKRNPLPGRTQEGVQAKAILHAGLERQNRGRFRGALSTKLPDPDLSMSSHGAPSRDAEVEQKQFYARMELEDERNPRAKKG